MKSGKETVVTRLQFLRWWRLQGKFPHPHLILRTLLQVRLPLILKWQQPLVVVAAAQVVVEATEAIAVEVAAADPTMEIIIVQIRAKIKIKGSQTNNKVRNLTRRGQRLLRMSQQTRVPVTGVKAAKQLTAVIL